MTVPVRQQWIIDSFVFSHSPSVRCECDWRIPRALLNVWASCWCIGMTNRFLFHLALATRSKKKTNQRRRHQGKSLEPPVTEEKKQFDYQWELNEWYIAHLTRESRLELISVLFSLVIDDNHHWAAEWMCWLCVIWREKKEDKSSAFGSGTGVPSLASTANRTTF